MAALRTALARRKPVDAVPVLQVSVLCLDFAVFPDLILACIPQQNRPGHFAVYHLQTLQLHPVPSPVQRISRTTVQYGRICRWNLIARTRESCSTSALIGLLVAVAPVPCRGIAVVDNMARILVGSTAGGGEGSIEPE